MNALEEQRKVKTLLLGNVLPLLRIVERNLTDKQNNSILITNFVLIMKKFIYTLLIVAGSFFAGWHLSYIYHEDLYHTLIEKIGLFQRELEHDRWIIEEYYKTQQNDTIGQNL